MRPAPLTYSTDAYSGFKAVGELCTQDRHTYLIYNAKNEISRSGSLSVGGIGENIITTPIQWPTARRYGLCVAVADFRKWL